MKYQRKSLGRRDAHARVAGDLAPPLPADDAGVLRRPRRPGAAGLRLGPGDREERELRDDVGVGVLGPGRFWSLPRRFEPCFLASIIALARVEPRTGAEVRPVAGAL